MSAVYSTLNKASITRAITKAKEVKPRVKVNGYNDFKVLGSKGETYTVCFTGAGLDFTGVCTCKANQGNKVCYHVAAVAPLYKQQVITKAAERATTAIATAQATPSVLVDLWVEVCSDCLTNPATTTEGRCEACQGEKDFDDLFSN